jgi:hypothetical protein
MRHRSYKDNKKLKVFLPVIAGLLLPVIVYIVYMFHRPLVIGRDSNSAVYGFWILNNIIFPVLILILLLIQWIIVLPWWNKIILRSKMSSVLALIGICLLIAFGLAFITWMPAFGLPKLVISITFVFAAQVIYWVANIIVLYLVDKTRISKLKSGK